ncbi:agmatine deiminase [Amphibacillus sp. Q70]|uniref:agmatine deiminase n=1 Tax=Amphibacillus sp. Q70 TaxID=3453416 RepID=UPI003F85A23D
MARTIKDSTPKKDGFRMPAEYEEHECSWIIWPERQDTWRFGGKPAQKVFVDVVKKMMPYETIRVICSAEQYENCRARIPEEVQVIEMSTDDSWAQDKGPFYVINDKGEIRGVNWDFNAYGGLDEGLYFPWKLDSQFAQKLLELDNIDRYDATDKLIVEGGAIQVDGEGTLIVTENSVVNENRNPGKSRDEVEELLKEYLNLEKVIWLKDGMAFDETDGHIDDVCFFVRPGVVALSWTDDVNNPQYKPLKEAYDILSKETDAKGRKLEIHKIPIPEILYITEEENEGIDISQTAATREAGLPLAVTYVNAYMINNALVVPQFNDPLDDKACEMLQELMPERKIIKIWSREWSLCGGNIHCMTLQKPKA